MNKDDLILQLLVEHGEMAGLELIRASGGRLHRGLIYVRLSRLEEWGLVVRSRIATEHGIVSIFRITGDGRRKLVAAGLQGIGAVLA